MTSKLEPPPPDFDENPELTEEHFANARPFKEGFPKQYAAWEKQNRTQANVSKVQINFQLAADVAEGVRATGPGYEARVEKVLREALANGKL